MDWTNAWPSGNAFVSRVGNLRFKSRTGQMGHRVANGSPENRLSNLCIWTASKTVFWWLFKATFKCKINVYLSYYCIYSHFRISIDLLLLPSFLHDFKTTVFCCLLPLGSTIYSAPSGSWWRKKNFRIRINSLFCGGGWNDQRQFLLSNDLVENRTTPIRSEIFTVLQAHWASQNRWYHKAAEKNIIFTKCASNDLRKNFSENEPLVSHSNV